MTLNVFSSSVETYNGTVNTTTALGPIGFDCYEVVTAASTANFTNNITFAQSSGSSLPSWLTFDTSTANVSISNPSAVSNDTYTITNTYTGVLRSTFTLETNAIISLAEEVVTNTTTNTTNTTDTTDTTNRNTTSNNENNSDDDHCMSASSEELCILYIVLIAVGAFILIAVLVFSIYCKFKKPKTDMTRVNQFECMEPDDNQVQNRQALRQENNGPNAEDLVIHKTTDARDNQV